LELAHEILITNVSIFDGTSEKLITGNDVVLKGNRIERLVPTGSSTEEYGQVIDGQRGYLTPGLLFMHEHIMWGQSMEKSLLGSDDYVHNALVASKEAEDWLRMGITTIRDAGGNAFGLKQAIDDGTVPGPRIYPSGTLISQYSGHSDFRNPNYLPPEKGGPLQDATLAGHMVMANGRAELMAMVRHQLFKGATQIKVASSGGVTSLTDPLYVIEFTEDEMRGAVEAAADFGTYVLTHVYNAEAIKRALNAGYKSIEHGMLIDEAAMELLVSKDAFLSPQAYAAEAMAQVETDPIQAAKLQEAAAGLDNELTLAKKYGAKVLVGTDLTFDIGMRKKALQELPSRKPWFTSAEIMIQATGNGGAMLATSRRGYDGKLGVVEEGAFADVLIYSKSPLEDVAIAADHESNLKLVIKDGVIYKNTL